MQFDVRPLRRAADQIVVVLQHDLLDGLETIVVAPMSPDHAGQHMKNVRRRIDFDGRSYVLQMDRMAAVPRTDLGPALGSLAHEQDWMKNSLDTLFFGI